MTTGRINQVTTMPAARGTSPKRRTAYSRRSAFRRLVFVTRLLVAFEIRPDTTRNRFPLGSVLAVSVSAQDPLFPDLTSFRPALLVRGRTRITAFSEDYQQPAASARCAQPRRIPEWLVANRSGHRQVIHILQQRGHKSQMDSVRLL